MAKTFTAPFAQTPKTEVAVVTAALTSFNTSTPANSSLLVTAGADGCIVTKISAMPRATVTATAIHLFLSRDGGTTKILIDTELMPAHTLAQTTDNAARTVFANISESNPMRLAATDRLYVGIGVALTDGIVFSGEWTDF